MLFLSSSESEAKSLLDAQTPTSLSCHDQALRLAEPRSTHSKATTRGKNNAREKINRDGLLTSDQKKKAKDQTTVEVFLLLSLILLHARGLLLLLLLQKRKKSD